MFALLRILLITVITVTSVLAETMKTTIIGSIVGPGGATDVNGTCTVSSVNSWSAVGGEWVAKGPLSTTIRITNGLIYNSGGTAGVQIIPGDTAIGGQQNYKWECALRGSSVERTAGTVGPWEVLVPTSATPVQFKDIVTGTPSTSTAIIQWSQMGRNGANLGDAIVYNGTSWMPKPTLWVGMTVGDLKLGEITCGQLQ